MDDVKDLLYDVSVTDVIGATGFGAILADGKLFIGKFAHNEHNVFLMEFGFVAENSLYDDSIEVRAVSGVGLAITNLPGITIFKGRVMYPAQFLAFVELVKAMGNKVSTLTTDFSVN